MRLLDHAVELGPRHRDADGGPMIDDPLVRERLARAAIGNEVSNLLGWRAAWMASDGTLPGVEGTMAKLFTTEHYQRAADDLIDLLGAEGLRRHGEPGAPPTAGSRPPTATARSPRSTAAPARCCRGIIAERGLPPPQPHLTGGAVRPPRARPRQRVPAAAILVPLFLTFSGLHR